jgi:hypothetical protein
MKPKPTDCPDCKEYIEQIIQLKTILTKNNDTFKKNENDYQYKLDEINDLWIDAKYELKMCKKLLINEWDKNDESN